jgi:hypothetical protein
MISAAARAIAAGTIFSFAFGFLRWLSVNNRRPVEIGDEAHSHQGIVVIGGWARAGKTGRGGLTLGGNRDVVVFDAPGGPAADRPGRASRPHRDNHKTAPAGLVSLTCSPRRGVDITVGSTRFVSPNAHERALPARFERTTSIFRQSKNAAEEANLRNFRRISSEDISTKSVLASVPVNMSI